MPDGQPERKLAGKYNSIEELEKGYGELMKEIGRIKTEKDQSLAQAEAYKKYSEQLAQMMESKQVNPAPQRMNLVDEDGQFNMQAFEQVLQAKIEPFQKEAQQARQTTEQLLNLLQSNAKTQSEFWGRDDVEETKFNQSEMNRFLKQNDSIRKVYETMLANPASSDAAYEYVFSTWRATRQPGKPQINEKQKQAATNPGASAGPAIDPSISEGDARRLRELQNQAALTRDPNAIMASLREQFKDSPVMEDLQNYAKSRGWKP